MDKKQIEQAQKTVKNGCPDCKDDGTIYAAGIQFGISTDITINDYGVTTVDLSEVQDDWSIDPILMWCGNCQKVFLDRRKEVADRILNWELS